MGRTKSVYRQRHPLLSNAPTPELAVLRLTRAEPLLAPSTRKTPAPARAWAEAELGSSFLGTYWAGQPVPYVGIALERAQTPHREIPLKERSPNPLSAGERLLLSLGGDLKALWGSGPGMRERWLLPVHLLESVNREHRRVGKQPPATGVLEHHPYRTLKHSYRTTSLGIACRASSANELLKHQKPCHWKVWNSAASQDPRAGLQQLPGLEEVGC